MNTASSSGADEAQNEEERNKRVMILAATNRPWDIDEAIVRRLEKRICKLKIQINFGNQ